MMKRTHKSSSPGMSSQHGKLVRQVDAPSPHIQSSKCICVSSMFGGTMTDSAHAPSDCSPNKLQMALHRLHE